MHHHVWSETRQTGYSVGVTVRLESALSALDLAKKMERVKERRSSKHATKDQILGELLLIAGVPGEKPQVTSDKLLDSPSKCPCIHL